MISPPLTWTKREIRALTGVLDLFMVENRPLSDGVGGDFPAWLTATLGEHRREILEAGIRRRLTAADRRTADCAATAKHYEARPDLCSQKPRDMVDDRPEIVARFERLAAEGVREAAWARKLLARLASGDLPTEVAAYDPLVQR